MGCTQSVTIVICPYLVSTVMAIKSVVMESVVNVFPNCYCCCVVSSVGLIRGVNVVVKKN